MGLVIFLFLPHTKIIYHNQPTPKHVRIGRRMATQLAQLVRGDAVDHRAIEVGATAKVAHPQDVPRTAL